MSLTAIILAAGKSTRMKGSLPKVLHEVCGRSMLEHVLNACFGAGCVRAIVVVGHGKEMVTARFAGDDRIAFVDQSEQKGTGHAVMCCRDELRHIGGSKRGASDVFILAGDGPLIRSEVLDTLHKAHHDEHAAASMATAILEDPTGYGRVVRDETGKFVRIVEQADASEAQRQIREVFPSYYCVAASELLWSLDRLTSENAKGEYYLTDIFGLLQAAGKKVVAVQAVAAEDVLGVNNRQQLAEVDAIMQERIQRSLRDSGVTVVSSATTYIESGVSAGTDTIIHPFSFIGRDSTIGQRCVIGPFACLGRQSLVPEGASIVGNVPGLGTPECFVGESRP
jgi:bifunctional UDP-N-acetylglucosamine pyrophosphorylase / glucosamine-1-phosphate N-acetyltransferase